MKLRLKDNVLPDNELGQNFLAKYHRALEEIRKDVLELSEPIEQIFIAMLAGGHVLLEGEPGVGKTLTIVSACRTINAKSSRIQGAPELRPSDMYYSLGSLEGAGHGKTLRELHLVPGPLFTQKLIIDEINRMDTRALAVLLEPMEEQQITLEGKTVSLGEFFFVLGTQNPVETSESTNELPAALQERLMLKIYVPYPAPDLIRRIAVHDTRKKQIDAVFEVEDIVAIREAILEQYVLNCEPSDPVIKYIQSIITGAHEHETVVWGPGIRAAQDLTLASAVHAFLRGRSHIGFADVRKMAYPALRFKFLRDERKIRKLGLDIASNDDVIKEVLMTVPVVGV